MAEEKGQTRSADAHSWRFYLSPHEAWDAMAEDCRNATKSIEVEQYIFENDAVGRRFMNLFIEKAAQGVKVFIICDKFGSATFEGSPQLDQLRENGGRFYFYNTVSRWDIFRPWRWFPRTHIKAMLVDSAIAYTGSACFAERMTFWRDTQMRITGPVVAQIQEAFAHAERLIQSRRILQRLRLRKSVGEFVYLQSYPLLSWNIIYGELVKAIRGARSSIYISTPFFAPNRRFRRLLRRAARLGIDVRLLVPHRSDVVFADWVFLSYAPRLLEAGVKIFRYNGFLHCKTAIIDDAWATMGSTNMDILSFFRNREANMVIRNPAAIAELKHQFMDDLQFSQELTPELLAVEPRWKLLIGYVGRLIKSFLWKK